METQIAATPVVKGSEAVKIYREANRKPSKASREGASKLVKKFSGKIKW